MIREEIQNSHQQPQEYIGRNLNLSRGVNDGIAWFGPEVPLVAWDEVVEFQKHGLPPPEPTPADGKDNGGDAESPNEEVDTDVPAGVDGFATAAGEEEEVEGDGVVD